MRLRCHSPIARKWGLACLALGLLLLPTGCEWVRKVSSRLPLVGSSGSANPSPGAGGNSGASRRTPAALPEPLGFPDQFAINGLEIVVLRRPGNLVTVEMVVEGGLRNVPPRLTGAEGLLWHFLLKGGTRNLDAAAYAAAVERAGARLSFQLSPDYSTLQFACLKPEFPTAWGLFSEAVFTPAWDANAYEMARHEYASQQVQGVDAGWGKADSLAAQFFFADHPYGRKPEGTYRVLAELPLDTLRAMHSRMIAPERMRLVITGDVTMDEVTQLLLGTVDQMTPAVSRPEALPPIPAPNPQPNYIRADSLPLNYVVGLFRAPAIGAEGEVELELALWMLQRRLVQDICLRRALTCEIGTEISNGGQGYGSIYFAALQPNPTIKAVLEVMAPTFNTGFTEAELAEARREVLGQLYQNVESNRGMASALAHAATYGQVEPFLRRPERIAVAKLSDVNRYYKLYLNSIAWTFYGDTRNVGRGIFAR